MAALVNALATGSRDENGRRGPTSARAELPALRGVKRITMTR